MFSNRNWIGNNTFAYDCDGNRIAKNTTETVWNNGEVSADLTGNDVKVFTEDNSVYCENGTFTFNAIDSKGDILASTSSYYGDYTYDAWGNDLYNTNTTNPIGYRGYYFDSETGLYYLKARYYDSTTGQFTQEDTVQDDNLQYNLYGYCSANPVLYMDPSGHCYLNKKGKICHDKWEYYDGYKPEYAKEYAHTWYNEFNPYYLQNPGGDCANFVSQCVRAGQLIMDNDWHSFNADWNKTTINWTYADNLYKYMKKRAKSKKLTFSKKKKGIIKNAKKVAIGDLLFFDFDNDELMDHATIITKTSKNDIFYSGHTNPAKDKSLKKNIGKSQMYVVKMKKLYKQQY